MAGRVEREDRVDHRQAGADQKDVFVARGKILDRGQCFGAPGIVDYAGAALPSGNGSGG
jgi:hypothetical protein